MLQASRKALAPPACPLALAVRGRGQNAEAHRLYLQGKYFIDQFTEEGIAKGLDYLQQALALDPSHAAAWTMMARAHSLQGAYSWVPVADGYRKARESVERALELAPDLAEAHVGQPTTSRVSSSGSR